MKVSDYASPDARTGCGMMAENREDTMETEKHDLSTRDLEKLLELARSGSALSLTKKVPCEKCGTPFPGNATKCPQCGTLYEVDDLLTLALEELLRVRRAEPQPAFLFCPKCGELHVDKLEEDGTDWTKRSHRKHLCHNRSCGHVWQPFAFPTYGVPLPTQVVDAIASLNQIAMEAVQERDAQTEIHATTSAQLAESQQKLQEVMQLAVRHGWDGVDNPKVLADFLDAELTNLAKRRNPRCQREECVRERNRVDVLEKQLEACDAARVDAETREAMLEAERQPLHKVPPSALVHCPPEERCVGCGSDPGVPCNSNVSRHLRDCGSPDCVLKATNRK